jgi:hypothetical protein
MVDGATDGAENLVHPTQRQPLEVRVNRVLTTKFT